MYNNPCHLDALDSGDDYVGLGFWTALIPIGTAVIGSAFGDGDDIDKRQYYGGAKSRIWCPDRSPPGADPALVTQGLEELDMGSPEGRRLATDIGNHLLSDRTWDELGVARPRTAREKAHALINWGNGWRYCPAGNPIGGRDQVSRSFVEEIVAVEVERRRTLTARAEAVATAAAAQVREVAAAQIIPGVSTPLLALGALGLGAAFLLRR